jgi:excisionase family DNA binding protein
MSITEAARWFRRDRSTIYAWIRSGDLPATKVNGRNYVARADAERLARAKGEK